MKEFDKRWRTSSQGRTSRAIFSAFCDSLDSGEDPLTGGPPQHIGLYRKDTPQIFGIVYHGSRFLCGLPLPAEIRTDTIEWRDHLYQRVDGETLSVLPGAQRHSRPAFALRAFLPGPLLATVGGQIVALERAKAKQEPRHE